MASSRDFTVGLTFFGLLFLLGALTVFFSDFHLGEVVTAKIRFRTVGGLEEGAAVRVDGLRSGKVKRIEREADSAGLVATIVFFGKPVLYEDASFEVVEASALGGRVIDIRSNPGGDRSLGRLTIGEHEGITRPGVSEALRNAALTADRAVPDVTNAITETAADVRSVIADNRENIRVAIEKMREVAERIPAILDKNSEDLHRALVAIRKVSESLTAEDEQGATIVDSIRASVANLSSFAEKINNGPGTIHSLATDPSLYAQVTAVVEDLRRVTSQLSPETGIGRVLVGDEIPETVAAIRAAAENLASATARLERKDNVIGMLLSDPQTALKVKRSLDSISDFIESTRESAPLTTFAAIVLSPF